MNASNLMTARQIAEFLQVSRSKAYRMMELRQIPVIQIGKNLRVRLDDLEEFIRTHRDSEEMVGRRNS